MIKTKVIVFVLLLLTTSVQAKLKTRHYDREKTIRLKELTTKNICSYKNELFTIYTSQKSALRHLKKCISANETAKFKITNDTLQLNSFSLSNYGRLNHFFGKQIRKKKVQIVNNLTGEKIETIRIRKYRYYQPPRIGQKGREFTDAISNKVIIRQVYWTL